MSFVFRKERQSALLRTYTERMKRVAPDDRAERRFVFFYQCHRQFGETQAYQAAPGTD